MKELAQIKVFEQIEKYRKDNEALRIENQDFSA